MVMGRRLHAFATAWLVLAVFSSARAGAAAVSAAPAPALDAVAEEDRRADQRALISAKIVGGDKVAASAGYDWMVSLQYRIKKFNRVTIRHGCGGTLIHRQWVLTAKHCLTKELPVRIQIGETDLSRTKGGVIRFVKRIVNHAAGTAATENDVALIKLDAPVPSSITPVTLMDVYQGSPEEDVGEMLKVIGWGYLEEGTGEVVDELRGVSVPHVKMKPCMNTYDDVTVKQICAGYSSFPNGIPQDSCSGDSGGPLFHTSETGLVTQVGVVSYGKGCARAGWFGIYSRVSKFYDFILDTLVEDGAVLTPRSGTTSTAAPTATPTGAPTEAPTPSADSPLADIVQEGAGCKGLRSIKRFPTTEATVCFRECALFAKCAYAHMEEATGECALFEGRRCKPSASLPGFKLLAKLGVVVERRTRFARCANAHSLRFNTKSQAVCLRECARRSCAHFYVDAGRKRCFLYDDACEEVAGTSKQFLFDAATML